MSDRAFPDVSDAATLRLRAGIRARVSARWLALLETELVADLGGRHDSGAAPVAGYPPVIDPRGSELNQAWLRWHGSTGSATFGRQRLLLDNQRWIGNSGWRQNEQTFDAVDLEWKSPTGLAARYLWLDRVHRVNGDDARDPLARERGLDSHVLDVSLQRGRHRWGAYTILHQDRDLAPASTATYGLRWSGDLDAAGLAWSWRAEAARQRSHGNNPASFEQTYWLAEPSVTWRGVNWRAGWEHLGGDGRQAVQTPLATLHAFNGWADKFGATPADGLVDRYLGAGAAFARDGRAARFKWAVAWHDFRSDHNDRPYGSEWDASLAFPVSGRLNGLVKVADYRSRGFAQDTRKLWLQLEWAR